MPEEDGLEPRLTSFAHDLFTLRKYESWTRALAHQKVDRWYSLIVELDRSQCDLEPIKGLGEDVYSKLVYRRIPSATFKASGEHLVLFCWADRLWHSLIYLS